MSITDTETDIEKVGGMSRYFVDGVGWVFGRLIRYADSEITVE